MGDLSPASKPNVLAYAHAAVGSASGSIRRTADLDSFDVRKSAFACGAAVGGDIVPLRCTVLFEGTKNRTSTAPASKLVEYGGGKSMKGASLKFVGLKSLDFT